MAEEKTNECCSGDPRLIFACSGAADVGEIADQAARKLTKENTGQMFCLAGTGGRIEPILQKTRAASKIIVRCSESEERKVFRECRRLEN
jgi:uncharacterized metal-binding protein